MKRKSLSVFLVLVLCLSLSVTVYAAPDSEFVIDELGYLAQSEVDQLNDLAADIYDQYGVGIFFVFTEAEDLVDYDISELVGDMNDYFIMLENEDSWYTFLGGRGENIDADAEEVLRDIYDEAETYAGGVEDFLNAASVFLMDTSDAPEASEAPEITEGAEAAEDILIYDEADLLSGSEEGALNEKLLDISLEYSAQIIVATISSMEGGDVDEYVEYLYDYMGFGYGENHDGVLLLVCMDPREYRILSNGFAADAIESVDIDMIGDTIVEDLSGGKYADAFDSFADKCAYYLDGYINGFPFAFGMYLLIALAVGIVAGLITALILKGQLKTVRKQEQANVYVKAGSMQVTYHNDTFLYSEVTRTEKESDDDNSSGSGTSRNVGGGSF